MICPRCGRRNDRSPLVIGIQFLVVAIFVCTVNWVVRAAAHTKGEVQRADNATVVSQPASAATSAGNAQQDVRF